LRGDCYTLALKVQDNPLDAGGEANTRSRAAAKQLNEAVVAATAADGALCSLFWGYNLEDRTRVVIQTSHEAVIECEGNADCFEQSPEFPEVGGAVFAEVVCDGWGAGNNRLAALLFAVEKAEGVPIEAGATISADAVELVAIVITKDLEILRTAIDITNRVELENEICEAQLIVKTPKKLYGLGIDGGGSIADSLGAELMVLPVAARLGAVVPENGREIPQTHGLREVMHSLLEIGAADGGGAFWSQREIEAAAVLEDVHLLLDDVGHLAHATSEKRCLLEDRRFDCLVAEGLTDASGCLPDEDPIGLVLWKDVLSAAGGLVSPCHVEMRRGY